MFVSNFFLQIKETHDFGHCEYQITLELSARNAQKQKLIRTADSERGKTHHLSDEVKQKLHFQIQQQQQIVEINRENKFD